MWLDEKADVFKAGDMGKTLQEIEENLDVHAAYEGRLEQYTRVIAGLDDIAASVAANGDGHEASPSVAKVGWILDCFVAVCTLCLCVYACDT